MPGPATLRPAAPRSVKLSTRFQLRPTMQATSRRAGLSSVPWPLPLVLPFVTSAARTHFPEGREQISPARQRRVWHHSAMLSRSLLRATVGLAAVVCLKAAEPARPVAAVFASPEAGGRAEPVRTLADLARAAGYEVERVGVETLTNRQALAGGRFDLLVLADARRLPAPALPAVEAFLKAGGDVLALGLPAWEDPLFLVNGRWLSRADYARALAAIRPARLLLDFEREDLSKWTRASDRRDPGTRAELVQSERGRALHVVVSNLTGWDTLASPALAQPFPPGQTITCFRAKGGPRTRQLAVEWTEQDGSRWIATVDLTPEWQAYALPPEAFKAWTPPPGRGGRGDRFNPQQAARLVVGLAHSHTALEGRQHEYWLDEVGTAPPPLGDTPLPDSPALPHWEGLCPGYLFFPVTTPVKVGQASGLPTREAVRDASAPPAGPLTPALSPLEGEMVKGGLLALHPRPSGVGYDQGRAMRWEPLLEARAADGDYRGALAALLVHERGSFRGGVWGVFTPAAPEFYQEPAVQQVLRRTLAAMRRGVFLIEGGSEFFTVFEGQSFRLGARLANFGRTASGPVEVRVTVRPERAGAPVFSRSWSVDLAPGSTQAVEQRWQPESWPEGGLVVAVELRAGGQALDRLTHELHVWRPKAGPEFVEARDGGFWLGGRPWKGHGVNYMPSSGIALANQQHFEHWLGRGAYDPVVIQRDLERIKAIGFNAVSAFIYRQSMEAQHLLDFLRRCEVLGLRVNLSLRPGTPMDFRWREMKELIEYYRLAQNDTVFAYDLAWEPSHYDEAYQRKHYTGLWRQWVLGRYGSAEVANKAWGAWPDPQSTNRSLESLQVPSMRLLTRDGPHRKLVADYRLFLDELVGARYAEARRLVKSIDPHHPVSFRMQHAGDPTLNWERLLPYDFPGLADAVDIWEPEAYGRIGDWDRVKAGHFTAAYARLCDPAKPIVWAEMGYNVWDPSRMAPHPDKLAFAAWFYADFYRMLIESGADGVFFWWYPGGYRLNERSDFGILNPDGTDRALTRVIRREGPRFLAAAKPPAPDYWIEVDRDADARGLFGVYEAVQAEYWRAIGQGKSPGLRWKCKPGTGAAR